MYVADGEKVPDDLYEQKDLLHRGGTIHDITDQICNLDANLHSYDSPTQLVVDRYMKEHGLQVEEEEEEFGFGRLMIDYKLPKKSVRNISNKEVEAKEVSRFAGVYSVRSVLQSSYQDPLADTVTTPDQSHSLMLKKALKKKAEKRSAMKPMLVELHVYPGYEPDEVTPLPPPLLVREIMVTVVNAQKDLRKKPSFKRELQSLLFSKTSQDILQDLFWWYFLEKYQPSKNIQEVLFNRIAHNYVKVLFTAPVTEYRDKFLKRYPSLLAQAVYCTFCTAFPTSYKQFGDEFKEDLMQLVNEWIFGTKPVPRVWDKWNLKGLEPRDMRKDEQIKQDASKGSLVSLPVELSEDTFSKQNSPSGTNIKLSQKSLPSIVEEKLSTTSFPGASRYREHSSRKLMAVNKATPSGSVTNIDESRDSVNRLVPNNATVEESVTSLPPSRLLDKDSVISFSGGQKTNTTTKRKESCPVGRGPEFSRSVFDVHGHSPLVEQFFRMKNLAKDSGTSVLIQRTEIKSLPPVSAPTYRELIRKSLKFSQALTTGFKKMDEENSHQRALFARRQKELNLDFTRREGELLSRQKDVKKLSELIYLELTKDGDEHSSGKVEAAISSAMGYGAENDTT